ncbi:MAG: YlxR family protein [Mogibacterium sp.]|nr:YlxR family protein [Mogibacterium sp.]
MAEKKIPMRRCIGCMTSYPKNTLIRIAYDGQQLTVDTTGRARGRGVYLCRNEECINTAIKRRALNRNFKTNFGKEETDAVFEQVLGMIKEVVNG